MSASNHKVFIGFGVVFLLWSVIVIAAVGDYSREVAAGPKRIDEIRALVLSLFAFGGTMWIMTFTSFNKRLFYVLPIHVYGGFKSLLILTLAAVIWFVVLQSILLLLVKNLHRVLPDATVARVVDSRLARDSSPYISQLKSIMPYEYTEKGKVDRDANDYGAFQLLSIPLFFESDNLINFTTSNREAIFQRLDKSDSRLARNAISFSSPQREALDLIFRIHNSALYFESLYNERIHFEEIIQPMIVSFFANRYGFIERITVPGRTREPAYRALNPIYQRLNNGRRISQAEATQALNVISEIKNHSSLERAFIRKIDRYLSNRERGSKYVSWSGTSISTRYDVEDGRNVTRRFYMWPMRKGLVEQVQTTIPNLRSGFRLIDRAISRGSLELIDYIESLEFAQLTENYGPIRISPKVIAATLRHLRSEGILLYGNQSVISAVIQEVRPFRQAILETESSSPEIAFSDESKMYLLDLLLVPWLVFLALLLMLVILTTMLTMAAYDRSEHCYRWGTKKTWTGIFMILFVIAGTNINAPMIERFQDSEYSETADPDFIAAFLLNWEMSFLAKFPLM